MTLARIILFVLAVWMLFGWTVVGAITVRHPNYFRRMSVWLYVVGGMVTAALWPNCVHLMWTNYRRAAR